MSLLTRAAATLAASAVVLAPSTVGAAHADDTPLPPHSDTSFQYDVTASGPLAQQHAGAVLQQRTVAVHLFDLSGSPVTATAEQLLYRTVDEQGQPATSITTVLNPSGAAKGLIGYDSFYDALGDQCDPSYTLRAGTTGQEAAVIGLLSGGYAVTVPDFEGQTPDGTELHWAAGHESGASTLDAVRATEAYLKSIQQGSAAATKVGLMGYSGGSIGAEWASEMAPKYAPELNLVGTAVGGIPVNLTHVMSYVDGSSDWSGVIPAALDSLGAAFGESSVLDSYESTTPTYDTSKTTNPRGLISGQQITEEVSAKCIGDFADDYPGLKFSELVDPAHATQATAAVDAIASKLVMGSAGTPKAPMLMMNGNKDGTGDGVMVAADVKALAAKYCRSNLPVEYTEVPGADHTTVGARFSLAGYFYLVDRFAGRAAPSTCARPTTSEPAPPVAPKAILAKLRGHSKGHKDVLVATAKGATGAKVKLFRAGHKKAIGHGTIRKNGKVTIKVKDRNGNAKTRYHATVAATSATLAAKTKVLRLR